MNTKKEVINNIEVNYIKTKKFKSIYFSIRFIEKYKKEHIEYRSLLSSVIKSRTDKYKSKNQISKKLEELFGASFYTNVLKRGNLSIFEFTINFINPNFANESGYLTKIFRFLEEIIYHHKDFSLRSVEEEKKLLIEDIMTLDDNKYSYGIKLLIENMFDDDFKKDVNGEIDKIKLIDEKKLFNYYKNEFLNNDIKIIVVGDFKKYIIANYIKHYFKSYYNNKSLNIIEKVNYEFINKVNTITKKIDMNQTILLLGYRSNVYSCDELFYPFLVGNAILGGYMNSKLFVNVREKAGLCYNINSFQDSYKGLLFVEAGININTITKAKDLIIKQIEDIKAGNFTITNLNMTKKLLINEFKEREDSILSMANRKFYASLINLDEKLSYIKKIKKVTKDEIMLAFEKVFLDTILILEGNDNEL